MKRIFVIGISRTGTKWLTSCLRQHPLVAAPESAHGGAHEFNLEAFSLMFPDLELHDPYIALAELTRLTDLYREMDLPAELPYQLSPRPRTVAEFLGRLMDAYAEKHGAGAWVQKFDPTAAEALLAAFPDAHFILCRRGFWDTLRSKVAFLRKRGLPGKPLVHALHLVMEKRMMRSLETADHYAGAVHSEELKADAPGVLARLFEQLGLPPAPNIITATREDQGHSSFRAPEERSRALGRGEQLLAALAALLAHAVPQRLMVATWKRLSRQRIRLIRGTFYRRAKEHGYTYPADHAL